MFASHDSVPVWVRTTAVPVGPSPIMVSYGRGPWRRAGGSDGGGRAERTPCQERREWTVCGAVSSARIGGTKRTIALFNGGVDPRHDPRPRTSGGVPSFMSLLSRLAPRGRGGGTVIVVCVCDASCLFEPLLGTVRGTRCDVSVSNLHAASQLSGRPANKRSSYQLRSLRSLRNCEVVACSSTHVPQAQRPPDECLA